MSNSVIYKKQTNNFGGWSYAARPEAEDNKFYKFEGEWFYVIRDREGLQFSLTGAVSSSDPNQLYKITDKYGVTKSIPVNNLVTTRVDDMSRIFAHTNFNENIENWDTGNVWDMTGIFHNSKFNQPIGNWDVRNLSNSNSMFASTPFNQPIGNWDTGNLWDMDSMFARSEFNQYIGNWDVRNVRNMQGVFARSSFNKPIENWDVRNVRNMYRMFSKSVFNQDLSSWGVSKVVDHEGFDLDTPSWILPKPNFNKKIKKQL